jgi:murein DD-endopeptidase MepM/ murein hydrolase activator NlpD
MLSKSNDEPSAGTLNQNLARSGSIFRDISKRFNFSFVHSLKYLLLFFTVYSSLGLGYVNAVFKSGLEIERNSYESTYGFTEVSDGNENYLTRGDFLKVLLINVKFSTGAINKCHTTYFSDVTIENDLNKFVCFAKEKQFIKGYADGTFRLNSNINLDEASRIIVRVTAQSVQWIESNGIGKQKSEKMAADESYYNQSSGENYYLKSLADSKYIPHSLYCKNQSIEEKELLEIIDRIDSNIQNREYSSYSQIMSCNNVVYEDTGFVNPMGDETCKGYSVSAGRDWSRGHTGIDFVTPSRESCWISSARMGEVTRAGSCSGGLGYCVVVRHPGGYSTLYAHGSGEFAQKADENGMSRNIASGDKVHAGERLMVMGGTGRATTIHLHFSLAANDDDVLNDYSRRINPQGTVPY